MFVPVCPGCSADSPVAHPVIVLGVRAQSVYGHLDRLIRRGREDRSLVRVDPGCCAVLNVDLTGRIHDHMDGDGSICRSGEQFRAGKILGVENYRSGCEKDEKQEEAKEA